MVEFPNLLRSWMGDRTRADVAPVLGVCWSTVHNWLLGQSTPPSTRIPSLAAIMGLPVEQLQAAIDGRPWPAVDATTEVPAADAGSVAGAPCSEPSAAGDA